MRGPFTWIHCAIRNTWLELNRASDSGHFGCVFVLFKRFEFDSSRHRFNVLPTVIHRSMQTPSPLHPLPPRSFHRATQISAKIWLLCVSNFCNTLQRFPSRNATRCCGQWFTGIQSMQRWNCSSSWMARWICELGLWFCLNKYYETFISDFQFENGKYTLFGETFCKLSLETVFCLFFFWKVLQTQAVLKALVILCSLCYSIFQTPHCKQEWSIGTQPESMYTASSELSWHVGLLCVKGSLNACSTP
jgi:hypothetical protein